MLLPVKFADGINTLRKKGGDIIYIEVGVGNTLATFVKQHGNCNAISTLPSAKESQTNSDIDAFHNAIGKLWNYGVNISWEKLSSVFNHKPSLISDLPNYQFDTTHYQIEHLNNYQAASNIQTNWMYSIGWQRIRGFGNKEINATPIKTAIILQDNYGISNDLIRSIKKQAGEIITLVQDNNTKDLVVQGSQIYINPYDERHYINLGNYLSKNNIEISHIFHCWTIADRRSAIDSKLTQFSGMYSIYFLQNHILGKYNHNIYLAVLTNGISQVTGSDVVDCNKGLVVGALRALSYEASNIKHLILDIGFDDYTENNLLSFVLNPDNYINEPYYAKCLSQLWKEVYTPLYLESSRSNIQDDDIILITGGLGGLGLAIAKEISTKWRVFFLLLTKNSIGSNSNSEYVRFQEESIQFIQNNDCMVDIMECDITNAIKVSEYIATAKKKFGKIDGVIHAASSMALTVEERNIASMQEHIKAKVEGALNLVDVLKEDGLKFFALTSSVDALVGGIGVFEYCAANSFLDTLSAVDYPYLNLISINWPNWCNIGMNLKFHGHNTQVTPFALNEEEGAKIFYNLIAQNHGLSRVAVSKIDINKLKASEFHKLNQREIQSKMVNASTDGYGYLVDEETTELENKVAEVFCMILGHKSISKYQSFFALGGDSLKIIKLLATLNTKINSSITMVEFYANNKVEDLAKFIEHKKTSSTSPHYFYESEI
jgi:acyl transferase domain-containing protein/acyl carrier protein